MKKRIIALLLLLVLVLTACTTTTAEPTKSGKEPKETDHESTEALPTLQEPSREWKDLDIGATDGNTYKNISLNLSCAFPDEWYLYNDTDIASLNNLSEDGFDHAAVADAVENNQSVTIFCASLPITLSSVNINVTKNALPDLEEAALIEASAPELKTQLEQSGTMENVTCNTTEVDFCGQKHAALAITGETAGLTLYETVLYLADGEYLYIVTVSSSLDSASAEILSYFSAIE